ncbi:Os07g0275600 [Oryza sativa Japonica Group]|uniref:Os07g0275600 protein n=1 Tax=Oryza sativa subsp. japonica TaxID=39947 RepID=A0A0P0X526_ORYSJ|nr:Os07g0275600 [Oryza sativa Japonica Group]
MATSTVGAPPPSSLVPHTHDCKSSSDLPVFGRGGWLRCYPERRRSSDHGEEADVGNGRHMREMDGTEERQGSASPSSRRRRGSCLRTLCFFQQGHCPSPPVECTLLRSIADRSTTPEHHAADDRPRLVLLLI